MGHSTILSPQITPSPARRTVSPHAEEKYPSKATEKPLSVGVCPKIHPLIGVKIEMTSWFRRGMQLLGRAVATLRRASRPARKNKAMKEFPLTFELVQHGEETSREVANLEELIALRSELELLVLSRAGQSRLACIALSNAASFADTERPTEFHGILVDALHPRVAKAIEQIDRDFPEVIGQVCRDVIETEAASFHKDVAALLVTSKSSRAKELSKTYALSVGLTPPDSNEIAETLDESENTMTEESNVPDPANKNEVEAGLPTDAVDEQAAQPVAQNDANGPEMFETTEDFEMSDAEGFDDVEDALNAMEADLQELQALAGSDVDASTDATSDIQDATDEALDREQANEPESAIETADEHFGSDMQVESTFEDASDQLQDVEAADVVEPIDSIEAMDATASASANSGAIDNVINQDETVSAETDALEAASFETEVAATPPVPQTESTTSNSQTLSAATDTDDDLDEAALAASLVAFNEAIAEIGERNPTAHPAGPQPSASDAPTASQTQARESTQSKSAGHRPSTTSRRQATSRSSSQRSRTSDVELSIGNFADFLLNEVNGMWSEARQGLDEICTVRDEIMAVRAEVSRIHEEIRTMRNSVMTARQDIRGVQSQIQNQRDDANRARQRADSAALDAQAACDRAAAAAREAESMAALCQPR